MDLAKGSTRQNDRPVLFVLGSGRSGTHLLGAVLAAFDSLEVKFEQSPIFELATALALDPALRAKRYPELVELYRQTIEAVSPRILADKSHPCLWLAEDLAKSFPRALFVGVVRDPYPTVASMLRHAGVLDWHRRWREFPIPNEFLGINEELAANYEKMSVAAQCALRWCSHANKMEALGDVLAGRLIEIQYEDLVGRMDAEVERLASFLRLPVPTGLPKPNLSSLDKWRQNLSAANKHDVFDIVNRFHYGSDSVS